MGDSDIVPSQPRYNEINYCIDYGNGPINIVIGRNGIHITPVNGQIDANDALSAVASVVFGISQLHPEKYSEFVRGLNTVLAQLRRPQMGDFDSLEAQIDANLSGRVSDEHVIDIGRVSLEQLTRELRQLYRQVTEINYEQLPLPLKFE